MINNPSMELAKYEKLQQQELPDFRVLYGYRILLDQQVCIYSPILQKGLRHPGRKLQVHH